MDGGGWWAAIHGVAQSRTWLKWLSSSISFLWHHQLNGHGFGLDSGSWWWTERPGVLWFIGSQRVGHDCATELNTSSFLHLWMMFSLSIFLPINMLHDLTFDKIKLILSSFFPFFGYRRLLFLCFQFQRSLHSLWKVLMILYLFYIFVWISGKGFGLGVKSLLTIRLKALGDLNFSTPSFFLLLKWDW